MNLKKTSESYKIEGYFLKHYSDINLILTNNTKIVKSQNKQIQNNNRKFPSLMIGSRLLSVKLPCKSEFGSRIRKTFNTARWGFGVKNKTEQKLNTKQSKVNRSVVEISTDQNKVKKMAQRNPAENQLNNYKAENSVSIFEKGYNSRFSNHFD